MKRHYILLLLIAILLCNARNVAQAQNKEPAEPTDTTGTNTEDLDKYLGHQNMNNPSFAGYYTAATFKSTRIINGHSIENVGKGVLDFRIAHRFGNLNEGAYNLYGLDK